MQIKAKTTTNFNRQQNENILKFLNMMIDEGLFGDKFT